MSKLLDQYYSNEYGERWTVLRNALEKDTVKSCLVNKYCDGIEGLEGLDLVSIELNGLCLLLEQQGKLFPKPKRDIKSLCYYYLLDVASVFPTIALQLHPHHRVLDMCAAPGGKSFAIAQQLDLTKAQLHLNEISTERRLRLMNTLRSHIPSALLKNVRVSGSDATNKNAFQPEFYDRILIDAPCSTDRHVIQKTNEQAKWSPSRLKTDASRQLALIISAWAALKPGGILVYATCSLSRVENDQVVARAINKVNHVELIKQQYSIGSPTEHGWIFLPDTCQNWGPLYFASLKKAHE